MVNWKPYVTFQKKYTNICDHVYGDNTLTELSKQEFDQEVTSMLWKEDDVRDPALVNYRHLVMMEYLWEDYQRPFYRVYPGILQMLLEMDISKVPLGGLSLPYPSIAIEVPADAPCSSFLLNVMRFKDFQAYHEKLVPPGVSTPVINQLCVFGGDDGEFLEQQQLSRHVVVSLVHNDIEYRKDNVDLGLSSLLGNPDENLTREAKVTPAPNTEGVMTGRISDKVADRLSTLRQLGMAVALLAKDPELITPLICKRHRRQYEEALRKNEGIELVHRKSAKHTGGLGFDIGKKMETVPHVRRPHPALVWTGPGRKIPKIVLRKGSVVKRKRVTEVPTGYYSQQTEKT